MSLIALTFWTVAWLLIGAEALCRYEYGWRFDVLTLTPRPAEAATPQYEADSERAYLAAVTYEPGLDANWFLDPVPLMVKPSSERLRRRALQNPTGEGQENYVWNDARLGRFADKPLGKLLASLNERELFEFHSYDGTAHPAFRLYPNNDFTPTPWITNKWGWLSRDVSVHKPPHTIRIGIIGDSTSHNLYGFYLEAFLNRWGDSIGLGDTFQVLNVARQGLGPVDELPAMRYELGPIGLDYVYQYFAPIDIAQTSTLVRLPAGVTFGAPPPRATSFAQEVGIALGPLSSRSALARLVMERATGTAPDDRLVEPQHPSVKLAVPANMDPATIPSFATLLENLEQYRLLAATLHATPLVSAERLCVWPGMVLTNSVNERRLYDELNGPIFWPLSYADIRTLLSVRNGVTRGWAASHGIPLVDIDGTLPPAPDLCMDPFHDSVMGQRLRAWIIFERLVPIIRRDVADGSVPRANSAAGPNHPWLDHPIIDVDRAMIVRRIQSKPAK